ncbi:MAG TPA: 30S ribosomal protein S20 [Verrucomicrobiota bacterium]|nr:30S ribosomal protein S20 [Verrucomicrobiota bacterium]
MPNTKSAMRRARSNERRHAHNRAVKSRLKTCEKNYLATIASGKKDEAAKALSMVNSALDKAAKTGVIHKATAERRTSRLSRRLNALK